MTYAASQVSYWVGQANDLSTSTHPPGYASGQRWSTTSSQWQTSYNTEYANARDTSTGSHPTGWVNGQLWSTTAGQWIPLYVTEYNNARDTGGGQAGSGMGAQHPPGWGYGQFYSTTADQWNAVWGSEWRNARDPQGYAYSYPGQGPNAVFWSQTAAYWKGQADYYWGPNRLWNSGSTWEQLYNAYVGYYNDMVSQRDTWQARANSAWGPNRVWANGESWEAAYNRVLPPAAAVHIATTGGVPSQGHDGWTDNWLISITTDRAGYWLVNGFHTRGVYAAGIQTNLGSSQGYSGYFWNLDQGSSSYAAAAGDWWYGFLGAGTQILAKAATGSQGGGTIYLHAWFIPNQSYAH